MKIIEFEFINKDIQFIHPTMKRKNGDDYYRNIPFKIGDIKPNESEADAIERVIGRVIQEKFLTFSDLPEALLRKLIRVVEFPQPSTFPKFSNEKEFTAFDGKYNNPEILKIRWYGPGQTWMYQMRNVGHIGDFYEEKYLKPK